MPRRVQHVLSIDDLMKNRFGLSSTRIGYIDFPAVLETFGVGFYGLHANTCFVLHVSPCRRVDQIHLVGYFLLGSITVRNLLFVSLLTALSACRAENLTLSRQPR